MHHKLRKESERMRIKQTCKWTYTTETKGGQEREYSCKVVSKL